MFWIRMFKCLFLFRYAPLHLLEVPSLLIYFAAVCNIIYLKKKMNKKMQTIGSE